MTEDPSRVGDSTQLVSDLSGVLAQLGGVLLSAQTVDSALGLVTRLATEAIPGSVGGGVTLVDERGKRTTAASDPLVEQADALQYEADTGPCLTAWRDGVTVRVDDVAADTRWPQWTEGVQPLGVGSVLSAPLRAGGDTIGAIKVYARQANTFDRHAETLLVLFAEQAAILLANTQTVARARQQAAQLVEALRNRDVIGQAKGILLAGGARSDQEAFAMLASASQRTQDKLHMVARAMVASVIARNNDRNEEPNGPSAAP